MKRFMLFAIGLIVLVVWRTTSNDATGCAPAPPSGFDVSVIDEYALIVWDPETKIEHFTRVAKFDTEAPDLGFLVPTPTVPTLTEVKMLGIVDALGWQTRARTKYKSKYITRYGLGPWPFGGASDTAALDDSPAGVQVLGQYDVAGYEASVLKAEDANALKKWLDDHEYPTSDSLAEWLQIYTDQGWIITAFKLSKKGESEGLSTKAVRLTFESEQPFYPYREPKAETSSANGGPRELKVFLLTDARYEGHVGENGSWPAKTLWSGPMNEHYLRNLAEAMDVELETLPTWLTEFVDRSSPRRGVDELYFDRSTSQVTVERPVKVITSNRDRYFPGWYGLFLAMGIAVPLIVLGVMGYRMFGRKP